MSQYKGQKEILWPNLTNLNVTPPAHFSWKRSGGGAVSVVNEGPWASMFELAQRLVPDYDALDISQISGNMFRLEASQNGDGVTITHEVSGSSFTKSRLSNSVLQRRFNVELGVSVSNVPILLGDIGSFTNQYKSGTKTYDEAYADAIKSLKKLRVGGADNGLIAWVIQDLAVNGESFLCAQYTYRRMVTMADRIFLQNQEDPIFQNLYADVDCIFSEALLRDREDIPETFIIPQAIQKNTNGTTFSAEWLKQAPPQNGLTMGQKRSIETVYLFADEWNRLLYQVAT